jgi:endonuclease/exonuclease/phosphatase (EEP) superfamily protein YafD
VIRSASVWAVVTLALAGCVNVPVSDQLITSRDERIVRMEDAACARGWQAFPAGSAETPALDSAGFTLMTWNVLKGRARHWPEDYARLSSGKDILLLQEAHLTHSLRALLGQSGYRWYMTRAFDYNGAATGVLTAGRSPAAKACLSRLAEPLIGTPKSALLTRFPLDGSGEERWVANLHGINFTLGTARFRAQLESLAEVLGSHTGPMVLAGDFNDWSERRDDIVSLVAKRLHLLPVQLAGDVRSCHWGRPVDHVFYRGLEVIQADAVKVTSSDHNPILVRFRLPGHRQERTP